MYNLVIVRKLILYCEFSRDVCSHTILSNNEIIGALWAKIIQFPKISFLERHATKPVNQWLAGFFVRAYKMFLVDVDFCNVFDLRYRP